MRIRRIGKVCGTIALLGPLWMYLLERLYRVMDFKSEVYILLCVSIAVFCIIALILSIIVDIKALNEKPISKRNKIFVYSAFALGMIFFAVKILHV